MRQLRALWMRICVLLGSARFREDFDAELENHVAEHTREGVLTGLSEAEARRQAVLRLGGAEQARRLPHTATMTTSSSGHPGRRRSRESSTRNKEP